MAMRSGDYVVDMSASSRHYRAVYRLLSEHGDRWLVECVGEVVNGRLQFGGHSAHDQTYRDTKNLQEWKS